MRSEGFENVKFRNSWLDDGSYLGINSAWRDPQTGRVFEILFHTPESFDAKMVTHDLYKQARLPDTDPATQAALDVQQDLVFDNVPRPAGLTDLTAAKL